MPAAAITHVAPAPAAPAPAAPAPATPAAAITRPAAVSTTTTTTTNENHREKTVVQILRHSLGGADLSIPVPLNEQGATFIGALVKSIEYRHFEGQRSLFSFLFFFFFLSGLEDPVHEALDPVPPEVRRSIYLDIPS